MDKIMYVDKKFYDGFMKIYKSWWNRLQKSKIDNVEEPPVPEMVKRYACVKFVVLNK
jgi:hypothetical protein